MNDAADVAIRPRGSRSRGWILSGLLCLLAWGALPPCAAAAPFARAKVETVVVVAQTPPCRERHFIMDNLLGNRSRMIQVATISLLLGLVILMRK